MKMLKPRLTADRRAAVPTMQPGSWRTDDMSANDRGYTYRWQRAREAYLRAHPLCVYCQREGRTTPATVLDHIVPHHGDKTAFWDSDNWQGCCSSCHNSIKAKEEISQGLR